MTTVRLSGAVLATSAATVRLSGAELGAAAGSVPVTVRLSGAVLGSATRDVIDSSPFLVADPRNPGGPPTPARLYVFLPDGLI